MRLCDRKINESTLNSQSRLFVRQLNLETRKMVKVELLLMLFCFGWSFCEDVEPNIKFVLYNKGVASVSTFKNSITEQGCDPNKNFSFVTHGWMGSTALWVQDLISNLTAVRQGCIIFMNYSYYSDRLNYFDTISYFEPISKLVTKKLVQLRDGGASNDRIFMFGFSFGGRIVIEAALNYGTNLIGLIHCKNIRFGGAHALQNEKSFSL